MLKFLIGNLLITGVTAGLLGFVLSIYNVGVLGGFLTSVVAVLGITYFYTIPQWTLMKYLKSTSCSMNSSSKVS
jgi:hypothetical protein